MCALYATLIQYQISTKLDFMKIIIRSANTRSPGVKGTTSGATVSQTYWLLPASHRNRLSAYIEKLQRVGANQ